MARGEGCGGHFYRSGESLADYQEVGLRPDSGRIGAGAKHNISVVAYNPFVAVVPQMRSAEPRHGYPQCVSAACAQIVGGGIRHYALYRAECRR